MREQMNKQINLTPLNDLVDEVWGFRGEERREVMESKLDAEVAAYFENQAKQSGDVKHVTGKRELERALAN